MTFLLPFRMRAGLLTILLTGMLSLISVSQVPTTGDCLGAIPVCEAYYFQPLTSYGVGNYPNEVGTGQDCPYDCLWGEANSVWYIFTVQQSGILSFIITPVDQNDDYDWALYDLTYARCEDIIPMMASITASCNSAGGAGLHGATGAYNGADDCAGGGTANGNTQWNANIPVNEGQTYVLYISDWTQSPTGYSLDLSPSTAVIFDDVPPQIQNIDESSVSGCDDTDIDITFSENITCSGITPFLFSIDGPGGPYQVVEVFGAACAVGAEMEKNFTLTVDHPFTSNGTYTLYLAPGFPGIQDVCNNVAPPDTILFTLSLGGPVIDESGLVIHDATCGMENGSVTGLEISGQTDLTYVWKNSQGAIVGDTPDLLDVPAEDYTLEVYDLNNCVTYAGPYIIVEQGAPEIDDASMVITPSNYGANNGAISGIIVNTSYNIDSYTWRDDGGNVVGTALDLTSMPSGYYDLTVIDENTCESHAGPYFIGELGGPLSANPIADPDVICNGESTTLSPGAGGGSGAYDFTWSSEPPGFSSSLENPVVSPAANTTYTVLVFDGYISVSGTVDVIVHPLPVPDAGTDQSIAHGTSTFLHGSAGGGSGEYAYSWSPVDRLIDATLAEPETKNLYETTTFYLETEDLQTGCLSEEPDGVTVNIIGGILNVNPSSFPDSVFCQGETFWLNANASGGSGSYDYEWTCSDPFVSLPAEASFSLALEETGAYIFYLKIDDGFNNVFGEVNVWISPAPQLNLGNAVQTYCIYDTVTLDAGNPGSVYLWSNGDTNRYIRVGTTGLGYDEQQISVHVTNVEGCEAEASVTIFFDYDACVGIREYPGELNARIYPNPNKGEFMLEVDDVSGIVSMKVYNLTGMLIYFERLISGPGRLLKETIDLSFLPKGFYLVKLQTNKGLKVLEVVID